MNRSEGELEREAGASRKALVQDVQALKEKIQPRRVMSDALTRAKQKGRHMAGRRTAQARDLALQTTSQAKDLAAKTTAHVRANPVAYALAGGAVLAGVGWLLTKGWQKRRDRVL